MEREAPFTVMLASCFLRFPKESFWNCFGSQSFPNLLNAPIASLARSLRSPHRGEFPLIVQWFSNILEILEIVSISIDLSWIFMPTWLHVGLIFRLLVHLGASRARLGASWGHLGGVLGRLGQVLGRLGGVLGRLGPS